MKIPTILGLSVIITAFVLGLMFYIYQQTETKQITQDFTPQNIRLSNITSNSFTVTWYTKTITDGSLSWGSSDSLGASQQDDRSNESPFEGRTHSVTLSGLSPQTEYFFKIRSGPIFFPQQALRVTTANETSPSSAAPLIGTVTGPDSSPTSDVLVFLTVPGGSDLSAPLSQNNFLIPLSNLRTQNLQASLTPTGLANLLVSNGDLESYVKVSIPRIEPVSIILGQNLDLVGSQTEATSTAIN